VAKVTCPECGLEFDDTYRLTICPHDRFDMRTVAVNGAGEERICTTLGELTRHMVEVDPCAAPLEHVLGCAPCSSRVVDADRERYSKRLDEEPERDAYSPDTVFVDRPEAGG